MTDKIEKVDEIEEIENDDEIETIVFEDQNGKEVEFVDIGCFEHDGKEYLALVPYDFMEKQCGGDCTGNCEDCAGEEDGGILYCEIVPKGKDEEELVPVNDDALNDILHAKFSEIMQNEMEDCEEPADK